MFNQDALNSYFSRFSTMNIPVNDDLREKIEFYCGGYPYLLEMLGYEIVERFFDQQLVDVEAAAKNLERSFLDQYDRLVDLMKEDGTLGKLLQILFGPVIDVKQVEVDDFLRYGLIKSTEKPYQAFSQHFQLYLELWDRTSDLWTVWKQVETGLRRLITEKMFDKYRENWLAELEKAYPEKLKPIFESCRQNRATAQKNFGTRIESLTNLLDYTYPKELFEIIFAKWNDVFSKIFGKDKTYWQQRSSLLGKVRNPYAHNYEQVILEHERKLAVSYCEEILEILNKQT